MEGHSSILEMDSIRNIRWIDLKRDPTLTPTPQGGRKDERSERLRVGSGHPLRTSAITGWYVAYAAALASTGTRAWATGAVG
ncbi:hypothetical protein PSEUDO8O_50311 [Pseudomonas sp. 8O]|nr:hypothetical protein PSEUDO8O_50311 [Pseudomonas sp. 8O]